MHQDYPTFPPALLERLRDARHVTALTGAGISAASGIPTFRGAGGLYKRFRPEQLATPEAFARDPERVWEWYGWRRDLVRRAEPNPAHLALARLAQRVTRMGIITQNVDGLHQRSPLPESSELVELHGTLWTFRCTRCRQSHPDDRPGPAPGELPHCACGGLERPAVVWFGEPLPPTALARAQALAEESEVFLVVGTSSVVQPAASFARVAAEAGAYVADFNVDSTALNGHAHCLVRGPAEQTLPQLLEALDQVIS